MAGCPSSWSTAVSWRGRDECVRGELDDRRGRRAGRRSGSAIKSLRAAIARTLVTSRRPTDGRRREDRHLGCDGGDRCDRCAGCDRCERCERCERCRGARTASVASAASVPQLPQVLGVFRCSGSLPASDCPTPSSLPTSTRLLLDDGRLLGRSSACAAIRRRSSSISPPVSFPTRLLAPAPADRLVTRPRSAVALALASSAFTR